MADCKSCKGNREQIPYIVHEGAISRMERVNKRLIAIIVLLIVLLVGSNIAWMVYESQFESCSSSCEIDAEQDGDGVNIVGGGDVSYGPDSAHQNDGQDKS